MEPARHRGFGQDPTRPQGLLDHSFNSRCPPVVTRDTIIVAVCGPNDHQGNASPLEDGWFFSDFYLFHHLFRDTATKQYWLTCVKPQDLVKRYKEFAHGDPRSGDRRIVLDKTFSKEIQDILFFDPDDLLERFLGYTTDACKNAKDSQQAILILIFGHRQEDDIFTITIGGAGEFQTYPKLSQRKLREAIYRHNPNPNIAFLTSTCFGGGWTQTSFLNNIATTDSDAKDEVLSWPRSSSIDRCCGSRYGSAVAEALIRTEIPGLDDDDWNKIHCAPAYDALVAFIHDILSKEIDVRKKNESSLSAQDDSWDKERRARSKLSLINYQEKWHALRQLSSDDSSSAALSESVRFSDVLHLSVSEAEFRLRRLAYDYMKSNPGHNDAAKNRVIHYACHGLLTGKTLSRQRLEDLAGALCYRMQKIVARATDYKDRLGIPFPDCRDVDTASCVARLPKYTPEKNKFSAIRSIVAESQLFDEPEAHEGLPYYKGDFYMALALNESCWDLPKIEEVVKTELVRVKKETSPVEASVSYLKTFYWNGTEEGLRMKNTIGTMAKSIHEQKEKKKRSTKQITAKAERAAQFFSRGDAFFSFLSRNEGFLPMHDHLHISGLKIKRGGVSDNEERIDIFIYITDL